MGRLRTLLLIELKQASGHSGQICAQSYHESAFGEAWGVTEMRHFPTKALHAIPDNISEACLSD